VRSQTRLALETSIRDRGGVLLTREIVDTKSEVRLRCALQHEWTSKASSILYNRSWCPMCARRKRRLPVDTIRQLAKTHGGMCLSDSDSYINANRPIRWQCGCGHRCSASVKAIKAGRWCPNCSRRDSEKIPLGFKAVLAMAARKGGEHLGTARKVAERTDWRCASGHQFRATGKAILQRNYFCKLCERGNDTTIADIDSECRSRGGRCVSIGYHGLSHDLNFVCAEGHQWVSTWRSVGHAGSWCPTCGRIRNGHKALANIAIRNSGVVLSPEYRSRESSYVWRCKAGHVFIATMSQASRHWCDVCALTGGAVDSDVVSGG